MISLLAESTPPPAVLASWLEVGMYLVVSGGGVVGLMVGIKTLREPKAETPQPLIIKGHVRYVEHAEFEKEMKQAHGRMNREKEEARLALEAFAKRFEADLGSLARQVNAYNTNAEARTDRINERIDGLRDAVAGMPQEILQLIRNAQQI
ncbi:MAG: hypothetical protein H2172_12465 [Opitutus sp.]|nr:hypothetical protein [Opitutus sp.]MCS6248688.1 hypothetical protein [Opitutus sp.]MCS6275920.1 hypothetical protein [Opitutus sp.]MCS6301017.1 hypothetical protein [Opitutus sp.]